MQMGDIVRSLRGRDSGRDFLVLGERSGRLLVVDGDLRTVARPKPKNPRHLALVGHLPAERLAGLREGRLPTDAEVRAWLSDVQEGGDADAEG